MADIFISHIEEDSHLAIQVATAVERHGYTTWYYERDSVPGPSYLIQVGREIEASQVLLLLASPRSLLSQHVTNEVIRAYEHAKHFVPLRLGITHDEIQEKQPIWRQCLGSTTSIPIDNVPVSSLTNKVLAGLSKLGVLPRDHACDAPGRSQVKPEVTMEALPAPEPEPEWGKSSIRFGDGVVSFRTERLEPVSPQAESSICLGSSPISNSRPTEVELAFQLLNQTDHKFTVAAIRVLYFGKIVVLEDCPAVPEQAAVKAYLHATVEVPSLRRTDLGVLEFTFGGDTDVAATETSSILSAREVEILKPRSLRSFLIRLRCTETTDHVVMFRNQLIGAVESVMHRTEQPWALVSAPAVGSIAEKITLEDLDRGRPEPVAVAHILALAATLVADTGDRLALWSDSIYSLHPRLNEALPLRVRDDRGQLDLERWLCQTPAQLVQYLSDFAIKTYNETLAFHVAAQNDDVSEGLNPHDVCPFCYWRDPESPFRPGGASAREDAPTKRGGAAANVRRSVPNAEMIDLPTPPVPRSNLVQLLASTLTRWPEFGTRMWEALSVLEATDDKVLKNKLKYLRDQLTAVSEQARR